MIKKIVSAAAALALVSGSAAFLPAGVVADCAVTAQAEDKMTSGDHEYTVLDDGTVRITKYNGSQAVLSVPAQIDGREVTEIGERAFAFSKGLKEVTLPETVRTISDEAFAWCKSLANVVIPDTVGKISEYTFTQLDGINTLIPEDHELIRQWLLINYREFVKWAENDSESASQWVNENYDTVPVQYKPLLDYQRSGFDTFSEWAVNKYGSINKCLVAYYNDFSEFIPEGCNSFYEWSLKDNDGLVSWFCNMVGLLSSDGKRGSLVPWLDAQFGAYAELIVLDRDWVTHMMSGLLDSYFRGPGADSVTIMCHKGSEAERFAKAHGISYELIAVPEETPHDEDEQDTEPLEVHTHKYTSRVTRAATYTSAGVRTYTCPCGDKYTKTIPKLSRKSIKKASVTLKKTTYVYSGRAKKPGVTVKLGKKTLKRGKDYTVTYKNNKKVGKATVIIKGKGAYSGSVTKIFRIVPEKTSLKKVTSPKKQQLRVKYKKTAGVTGYIVKYSTSKKFARSASHTVKVRGDRVTSKLIGKLRSGATYYVKVRTYKTVSGTKYYSGFSKVRKIKVK